MVYRKNNLSIELDMRGTMLDLKSTSVYTVYTKKKEGEDYGN